MTSTAPNGASDAPPLDLIVVGAGLSGLVAAFRAQRAGLKVLVIESASRPGGVIGQHDGTPYRPQAPVDGLVAAPDRATYDAVVAALPIR